MTTIVYCHKTKQIACDSRSTVGGTIETDSAEKFILADGEMWFFCGAFADFQKLIDMHNEVRPAAKLGCSAFVATKDGIFCRGYDEEQSRYMPYKLNCSWATGSGTDHALTALDMGATAKQAVEMAIKRDVWSGGKVRVFDCLAMEFIE
jgi:ATP-dependent protease HslVU (ClpYQ) peptidase subunit